MQLKRTDIDIDQAITLVQGLAQECEDLAFEFSGLSDGRGKYMDWESMTPSSAILQYLV